MSIIQLKNSVTKLYPVISNKTMKSVYIGRLVKGILSAPPTAGQLNSDTLEEKLTSSIAAARVSWRGPEFPMQVMQPYPAMW